MLHSARLEVLNDLSESLLKCRRAEFVRHRLVRVSHREHDVGVEVCDPLYAGAKVIGSDKLVRGVEFSRPLIRSRRDFNIVELYQLVA